MFENTTLDWKTLRLDMHRLANDIYTQKLRMNQNDAERGYNLTWKDYQLIKALKDEATMLYKLRAHHHKRVHQLPHSYEFKGESEVIRVDGETWYGYPFNTVQEKVEALKTQEAEILANKDLTKYIVPRKVKDAF